MRSANSGAGKQSVGRTEVGDVLPDPFPARTAEQPVGTMPLKGVGPCVEQVNIPFDTHQETTKKVSWNPDTPQLADGEDKPANSKISRI